MAFAELSEFLSCLEAGALRSAATRAELVERLEALQTVFLRLGARAPAAQLDLAAQLLRSCDGAEGVHECLTVVRRMVVPIERAFRLDGPTVKPAEDPGARARESTGESRGHLKARLGVARDMLLGEMLVHFGVVEPQELAAALAEKQRSSKRLGEILVQQGATTAEEIQRALVYQARVRGAERSGPAAPARSAPERKPAGPKPEPALPRNERAAPLRMTSSLLLGEILFMQGSVTREELARGLAEQRRTGRMLGEILLELGRVTRRQLEHALSFQGTRRPRSSVRRAA